MNCRCTGVANLLKLIDLQTDWILPDNVAVIKAQPMVDHILTTIIWNCYHIISIHYKVI